MQPFLHLLRQNFLEADSTVSQTLAFGAHIWHLPLFSLALLFRFAQSYLAANSLAAVDLVFLTRLIS